MLPGIFSEINDLPLNLCLSSTTEKNPTQQEKTLPGFYRTSRRFFTSVDPAEKAWSKTGDRQLHSLCLSTESHLLSHILCALEGVLLCFRDLEEPIGLDQYCEHWPVVVTARGPHRKVINKPCLPESPLLDASHACVLTDLCSYGEHPEHHCFSSPSEACT